MSLNDVEVPMQQLIEALESFRSQALVYDSAIRHCVDEHGRHLSLEQRQALAQRVAESEAGCMEGCEQLVAPLAESLNHRLSLLRSYLHGQ